MEKITACSFPRAGFLGNPSDGYYGKTISFAFSDFGVELTLVESKRMKFVPGWWMTLPSPRPRSWCATCGSTATTAASVS